MKKQTIFTCLIAGVLMFSGVNATLNESTEDSKYDECTKKCNFIEGDEESFQCYQNCANNVL